MLMDERTIVLYVDDNPKSSRLLASVLEECGFSVISKNDPLEALTLCRRTGFDLALLDYEMPAMSGATIKTSASRRSSNRKESAGTAESPAEFTTTI